MQKMKQIRRSRALLSSFTVTQLHFKNPWIPAFFSFSFPGFGYVLQHRYLTAFAFLGWEIFINQHAHINQGILYTLLGQFAKAKEILDQKWLMLYVGIYMYGIWDGYRSTLDMNKLYLLADREDAPLSPLIISTLEINYLDKRIPWLAATWSILIPGLGFFYCHKILKGFLTVCGTLTIIWLSHFPQAILSMMIGNFAHSKQIIDMQWMMYLPSIFFFVVYDSYANVVELNKLFEKEQAYFLRNNYQQPHFKMPI